MKQAPPSPDSSWNLGRFAKTFTFFNGNPLLKLVPFAPSGAPSVRRPEPTIATSAETTIFDFGSLDKREFEALWAPLDDVVMGGVSASQIVQAEHGATLSGVTSSKNNGGFCSARTRNVDPAFNLGAFTGVAVKVFCERGMRYKIILRDREGWDTVAWCHSFDTTPGKWMDLKVPFSSFIPVVRGSTTKLSQPIDSSSIYSVQLMLSKYEYDGALNPNFEEGPFSLGIAPIRAYK
eukprot:CAMPEP_0181344478 /NCGR_PEP_ID=MMETSP1101-20121128/32196_1 /TAXON_ID=46948 /ORGANISM="Rhodomonas abbreviata, Strain Caron Lab Isolate" /LENGTH=234 /DNA_ID=CAMNT_0023456287 /DNA_START=191 /DNA_END=895 /DNA_ORIENTATION=+